MEASKHLSQGFIDLRDNVGTFQEKITKWMKQSSLIEKDTCKIARDVRDIEREIQRSVLQTDNAFCNTNLSQTSA